MHISPKETLALKVKCNYDIFMLHSLFVSICFFLPLERKIKKGSKGRGEMALLVVKGGEV